MIDQRVLLERRHVLAIYAQATHKLSDAATELSRVAGSYELDAFHRTWRRCEELQELCADLRRRLHELWQHISTPANPGASPAYSVLIIDKQTIFRRGLREVLAEELRGARIREVPEGHEALIAVGRLAWDIVILSLAAPDHRGLGALQEILRHRRETKVLVVSDYGSARDETRALRMGARGYVSRHASRSELLKAVRDVLAGKDPLPRTHSKKAAAAVRAANPQHGTAPSKPLSGREQEIVLALAAGKSISDTARQLSLSVKTVSTYKRRIFDKLQLESMADLVRYAMRQHFT